MAGTAAQIAGAASCLRTKDSPAGVGPGSFHAEYRRACCSSLLPPRRRPRGGVTVGRRSAEGARAAPAVSNSTANHVGNFGGAANTFEALGGRLNTALAVLGSSNSVIAGPGPIAILVCKQQRSAPARPTLLAPRRNARRSRRTRSSRALRPRPQVRLRASVPLCGRTRGRACGIAGSRRQAWHDSRRGNSRGEVEQDHHGRDRPSWMPPRDCQ